MQRPDVWKMNPWLVRLVGVMELISVHVQLLWLVPWHGLSVLGEYPRAIKSTYKVIRTGKPGPTPRVMW